jgi:hypothetical protein
VVHTDFSATAPKSLTDASVFVNYLTQLSAREGFMEGCLPVGEI